MGSFHGSWRLAVAGVGAAPGLAVAGAGGAVSVLGSVIELGVKLIVDPFDSGASDKFIKKTVSDFIVNKAIDAVIPGPTPSVMGKQDINPVVKEGISQGVSKLDEQLNAK